MRTPSGSSGSLTPWCSVLATSDSQMW
jgi:hypothetical protein